MSKDRFRKHYEELDDAERKVAKEKKRLQTIYYYKEDTINYLMQIMAKERQIEI